MSGAGGGGQIMPETSVKAALAAGEELGKLKVAGTIHQHGENGFPFIVNNSGEAKSIEHLLAAPVTARASVVVHDAASFIAYVNQFADKGSIVFANLGERKFEAILDYHIPGEGDIDPDPRWGKHRVTFTPVTTPAWATWTNQDKKAVDQVPFARFIEDNIPDIAAPPGADLLEMCLTLEAKIEVQFRSGVRLQNGEHQLTYQETIEGKAADSSRTQTFKIPDKFSLVLSPFQGVDGKQIDARFRYRIADGDLKLWFELVRATDVLTAAFNDIVEQIKGGIGDTPLLAGAAPSIA